MKRLFAFIKQSWQSVYIENKILLIIGIVAVVTTIFAACPRVEAQTLWANGYDTPIPGYPWMREPSYAFVLVKIPALPSAPSEADTSLWMICTSAGHLGGNGSVGGSYRCISANDLEIEYNFGERWWIVPVETTGPKQTIEEVVGTTVIKREVPGEYLLIWTHLWAMEGSRYVGDWIGLPQNQDRVLYRGFLYNMPKWKSNKRRRAIVSTNNIDPNTELELLRQFVKDTVDGLDCEPDCDSLGHSDLCPVANEIVAWRRLRERLVAAEARIRELESRPCGQTFDTDLETWDDRPIYATCGRALGHEGRHNYSDPVPPRVGG